MSNEINIDDLLGDDNLTPPSHGKEEPKQSSYSKPAYNGNYKKNENKVNMYDVEFIEPKDIDTSIFEKDGKSFMVIAHDAPEEVVEKILKVVKKLHSDGFIFRHDGNATDTVQNKILEIYGDSNVESYIPFKKYNEDIEKPISPNGYEAPFRYASKLYGGSYNEKLSKGAKAVYASKVHALLGKDSNSPIDFLLCYSASGDETYPPYKKGGPKIDYSKLNNTGFYLRVTDATSINVYNFKNSDSIKNLVELIK